jgi:N-acetyl-gamma-glutamyl-phosphate reductase/acetylglutamate kinase
VLALPNGAGASFVAVLDEGAKARSDGDSMVVDLSADYRFDDSGRWAYGLPGEKSL